MIGFVRRSVAFAAIVAGSALAPVSRTRSGPPGQNVQSMRPDHRLRRASIGIGIGVGVALLCGAQPATATPIDTVFPVPVVGIGVSPPGLPTAGFMYVIATTDPATPGVTRFSDDLHCCGFIHWRNISTGAAGIAYLGYPSVEAQTGSGTVVATVTVPDGLPGYPAMTLLPGAGIWTVP